MVARCRSELHSRLCTHQCRSRQTLVGRHASLFRFSAVSLLLLLLGGGGGKGGQGGLFGVARGQTTQFAESAARFWLGRGVRTPNVPVSVGGFMTAADLSANFMFYQDPGTPLVLSTASTDNTALSMTPAGTLAAEAGSSRARLDFPFPGTLGGLIGRRNEEQGECVELRAAGGTYYIGATLHARGTYGIQNARVGTEFNAEQAALPTEFSPATQARFFAFFDRWGTHYVHEVSVGGSVYVTTQLSAAQASSFNGSGGSDAVVTSNARYFAGLDTSRTGPTAALQVLDAAVFTIDAFGGDAKDYIAVDPPNSARTALKYSDWVDSLGTDPPLAPLQAELRAWTGIISDPKRREETERALGAYIEASWTGEPSDSSVPPSDGSSQAQIQDSIQLLIEPLPISTVRSVGSREEPIWTAGAAASRWGRGTCFEVLFYASASLFAARLLC